MATKFIGRQFNVGIAKETARGTAVVPAYWLPKDQMTIEDKIKTVKDEQSYGVIEDGVGQEITEKYSAGSIQGSITDQSFGLLLGAVFGTDTAGAVESGVKDHVFTVLQTAQHPSLTFSVVEPNSNAGAGYGYPLAMIEDLEFTFELNKYAMYKASFEANVGANLATTTAYVAENRFRPQDGSFKLAANLAGLGAASPISIKKASVTIKQNVEADTVIGNINPTDRLNKQFEVSGSFELFYSDRIMIDTDMLADLAQAMEIKFINAGVTIGATSHPTLTIQMAKVKFEEVARKIDNKGITHQTVKFKAFYSITDTKMITITLRNAVSAAYV